VAATELAARTTWSARLFRGAGTLRTSWIAIPAASSAVSQAIRLDWRVALRMVTSGSFMTSFPVGDGPDVKGRRDPACP